MFTESESLFNKVDDTPHLLHSKPV